MREGSKAQLAVGCAMWAVLGLGTLIYFFPPPDEPPPAPAAALSAGARPARQAPPPGAAARAEGMRIWRSVLGNGMRCDTANSSAVEALNSFSRGEGDVYRAFDRAREGEQACTGSADAIAALRVAQAIGDGNQRDWTDAINGCSLAYVRRAETLATMQIVLDGDQRPSTVSRFQDETATALHAQLMCVTEMMQAGIAVGLTAAEMQSAAD